MRHGAAAAGGGGAADQGGRAPLRGAGARRRPRRARPGGPLPTPPPPKHPSSVPIAFGCWCVEGCRRALCLRRRRGGMAATKSWPSCLLGWRCFLGTSCVGCGGEPTGKAPCHPPPLVACMQDHSWLLMIISGCTRPHIYELVWGLWVNCWSRSDPRKRSTTIPPNAHLQQNLSKIWHFSRWG